MKRLVIWSEHARFRMHLRRIPRTVVERVLASPIIEAKDSLTGNLVAVGKVSHKGKTRFMMVAYEETDEGIRVITVHPIRASQYRFRLQRGRWKEI